MPTDLRVILLTPTIQFSGTFPSDLWTIITIKVKTVVSSLLNTTVSPQIKDDHIWAVLCSLALNQFGQFACHSLVCNSRRFCLSRTDSEPAVSSPSDTRNCWGSLAAYLCYSSTWDEQDWKSLIHTGDCPPAFSIWAYRMRKPLFLHGIPLYIVRKKQNYSACPGNKMVGQPQLCG